MNKLPKPYVLEDNRIQSWVKIARKNWCNWHDVFQHAGRIADNPVLADKHRFASFLADYYVGRTVRKGRHDEFRRKLAKSRRFRNAISDNSGQALDRLEQDLKRDFGSKKGKNRLTSVLSKVSAFVRPERFVAWDRFAKRGLNIVLCRGASSAFETYSAYLAAFDSVWKGQPGKQIRDYAANAYPHKALERETRFLRRVLDVYLMDCGGRWSRKRRRK